MADETRSALITGGTRGIGLATAKKLTALGWSVMLTGRSQTACDEAVRAIQAEVPGAQATGMVLDLNSFESVRKLADAIRSKRPLQLLINNAGRMSDDKTIEITGDGIEATLATNVFGPFLLTHLLLDTLKRSAPARIINVGSRVHMPKSHMGGGEVNWDWENLRGEKGYNPSVVYKNSKLATMWFTYELNRRLAGTGIVVNAVCPGFVPETLAETRKGLSRILFKHVLPHLSRARTVDEAADNTVFAATDPVYATRGGVFIGEKTEVDASEQARDAAQAKRFWKLACQLTGVDESQLPATAG
jgi:retinol dehydrogenase-12